MSPELETLDQLQGGDLTLDIISRLFPSAEEFRIGVSGLLSCGDVLLIGNDDFEVAAWRWKELLSQSRTIEELHLFRLRGTDQGFQRIR